jgi:hypothetical protein
MAWEARRGRQYYYRSRRVDGRVVKVYFGAGVAAEAAAREDQQARQARAAALAATKRRQVEAAAVDRLLREYLAQSADLLRAALLEAGFIQHHRGEWRHRRGDHTADEP